MSRPHHPHRPRRLHRFLAVAGAALAVLVGQAAPAAAAVTYDEIVYAPGVNGTYTPIVGDFLGDVGGGDDIIWYAPGGASDHVWSPSPSGDFTSLALPRQVNGTYTPIVGNFGGDGLDDILWYAPGPAADSLWVSDGTGFTPEPVTINGTYLPAVLEDTSGYDDIIWARPGGGAGSIWVFHGQVTTSRAIVSPPGSRPLTGRFNDGGCADVFWYAPGAAEDALWYANCAGITSVQVPQSVVGSYQPVVVGAAYQARDGILWVSAGGALTYWDSRGDGTWDTSAWPAVGAVTPVAAGTSVYLHGDDGADHVLLGPGLALAALHSVDNTAAAPAAVPLAGTFTLGGAGADVFWYTPGPTAERLFHGLPVV